MDTPTLSARDRYLLVPLTPVESSNISAIGYDPDRRWMSVEFKSGALHQYRDVPADIYAEFKDALSVGSYYAMNVRGKFPSDKLSGECPNCGGKPGLIGEKCMDCGQANYAPECGEEGPGGMRCSKPRGHEHAGFDDARFHGRGKKTWKPINGGS